MLALVLGATGVLGRNVVPRLQERGHRVRAVVRGAEQAARLRRMGVETVVGDILDLACLRSAAQGCEGALHLASAIPRPGAIADWSLNDRILGEGTRNLIGAAVGAGVRCYVQQSVTFLYGDQGPRIVDETTPLSPPTHLRAAAAMEEVVRGCPLRWCILRGGAFYGPGTGEDQHWREVARVGTLSLPGQGEALISLIHVADMAQAAVEALEHAPGASVYNVVDDEPVDAATLYGYVAARAGGPEPLPGGPPEPSLGCSNARLRADLGWRPAYPTYRSGLAD